MPGPLPPVTDLDDSRPGERVRCFPIVVLRFPPEMRKLNPGLPEWMARYVKQQFKATWRHYLTVTTFQAAFHVKAPHAQRAKRAAIRVAKCRASAKFATDLLDSLERDE